MKIPLLLVATLAASTAARPARAGDERSADAAKTAGELTDIAILAARTMRERAGLDPRRALASFFATLTEVATSGQVEASSHNLVAGGDSGGASIGTVHAMHRTRIRGGLATTMDVMGVRKTSGDLDATSYPDSGPTTNLEIQGTQHRLEHPRGGQKTYLLATPVGPATVLVTEDVHRTLDDARLSHWSAAVFSTRDGKKVRLDPTSRDLLRMVPTQGLAAFDGHPEVLAALAKRGVTVREVASPGPGQPIAEVLLRARKRGAAGIHLWKPGKISARTGTYRPGHPRRH